MNMFAQRIVTSLWWGRFRRPFEAVARRMLGKTAHIQTGPLRRRYFRGGLAQILGIYEPAVQKALEEMLNPGDVFYDIGANNGYFSLLGAKLVRDNGLVFAFEPLSTNLTSLQKVIDQNQLCNCLLVDKAVSNLTGHASFYVSSNLSTSSLLDKGQAACVIAETVTLDAFISENPKPNVVKTDVEGAEVAVLEGAQKLLTGQEAPVWVIEVHTPENDSQVRAILQGAGYHVRLLPHPRQDAAPYPAHWIATQYA